MPRIRAHKDLTAAVLLLSGSLVLLPSLGAYFLSDDFVLLSWTRAGSVGDVLGFFDPNTEWFYRPLVKVYYWLGQNLFGLRGVPFHALSIALHLVNAYMLYRLVVRQELVPWGGALLVALLFLLNAHHAETVSWVAAVGDLLGTTCMLGSLLLFIWFVENGRWGRLVSSLALFVLGLLTRESVVLLPVLLTLYVLLLHKLRMGSRAAMPLRKRDIWLIAYFALLVAYVVFLWAGRGGGEEALSRGGLQFRVLNFDSLLLGIMDYVHGLVPGGQWLASQPLETLRWVVWVEAALLVGVGVALWRWKRRVALLGLAWLLITPLIFVPFSGPTDRYFYLPSIGFALILGDLLGSIPRLVRDAQVRPTVVGTAAVLAAVAVLNSGVSLYKGALLWRDAGQVSGGVLNDVRHLAPNPQDDTRFHFAGVPTHLNGVPLFANGFQEAIRLTYNNPTLTTTLITCDSPPIPPNMPIFRFKGDGVELVSLSELCP